MSLNSTNLFIQAAPLPATFRGSPNDFFAEMIRRMKILSPSGTNFIFIGDTEPTSNVGPWLKNGTQWYVWDSALKQYRPQDISASFTPAFSIGNSLPTTIDPPVWLRTEKDATSTTGFDYGQMIRWFVWDASVSKWLSPHPSPPSSSEVRIWKGSETALWAYDGGDGSNPTFSPPTDSTGAMWEVDSDFAFKFPIGVGTNSVTYDGNPAKSIAPGETGGEERHVLTLPESPAHNHTYNQFVAVGGTFDVTAAGANFGVIPGSLTGPAGSDGSHENLPPFRGVYFIKRTARKFYTP
jgi:hypothetical protein